MWGWSRGGSLGCMCASSPQVGSIEPTFSLLLPLHAVVAFFPKSLPSHQNTPNGKKIWREGLGRRRLPLPVFYRARPPDEHGLEKKQRRVWTAETTEHKADGRKRSDCRLAFLQHDSSSACNIPTDAHKGDARRRLLGGDSSLRD